MPQRHLTGREESLGERLRKWLQISGLNLRLPSAGGGGDFIFVAANPATKAWLQTIVAETRPWEGADLRVGGVEMLQNMLRAMAWISGILEDPSIVLLRLGGFNPSFIVLANRQARAASGRERGWGS